MRALATARGVGMGRHSSVWSGCVCPQRGTPDDDDPHPTQGVRIIYLDPFGDWEVGDMVYLGGWWWGPRNGC